MCFIAISYSVQWSGSRPFCSSCWRENIISIIIIRPSDFHHYILESSIKWAFPNDGLSSSTLVNTLSEFIVSIMSLPEAFLLYFFFICKLGLALCLYLQIDCLSYLSLHPFSLSISDSFMSILAPFSYSGYLQGSYPC